MLCPPFSVPAAALFGLGLVPKALLAANTALWCLDMAKLNCSFVSINVCIVS